MRNLKLEEVLEVHGGEESASETVARNAETAEKICGAGNVKSVTTEGFECK